MFEFHQDRLKIKDKLGKGRFGTVFPYQKHSEDLKWVVKRIKAEDSDALVASLPEVILGMSCDHPNVVPIKGYFIEKNDDNEGYNIYTKLPRMKGTLLEDFNERKTGEKPYSEEEIIRHFYSLVCGVEYLHKKKVFHGDIKPETLLLDENGAMKIGDIGISKHLIEEKAAKLQILNYQYSAPEVLGVEIKKEMLRKADIWSLGVVVLELCCFDLKLLNASLPKDQLQMVLNDIFGSLQGKYHHSVIDLLQRILSLDPKERPELRLIRNELEGSFSEILHDKAQTGVIKVSDEQKQEMFGRYEAEIKHLKSFISELKSELAQKLEIKTPAKSTTKGDDEETKTNGLEEEIRKLKEERSKIYRESDELLIRERVENKKLQETIKSLEVKLKGFEEKPKIERPKRETHEAHYESTLREVVSKLNSKWNKWYKSASFECKADGKFLQVNGSEKKLTDEDLRKFSKDITTALEENYLLNLQGLTFFCSSPLWTDVSISDFAYMLSNDALKLKHLVIYIAGCKGITDKSIEYLSKALAVHLPHFDHLRLIFRECPGLTDKSLEHLAKLLSNPSPQLLTLELNFENVKKITDTGYENLAKGIEKGINGSRRISFLQLRFPDSGVTPRKKDEVKKRFEKIEYLTIL